MQSGAAHVRRLGGVVRSVVRRCTSRLHSTSSDSALMSIAGRLQPGECSRRAAINVLAPCTGEKIAVLAQASSAQMDEAVREAQRCAFRSSWGTLDAAPQRQHVLQRIAQLLRADRQRFAELEACDAGKPLGDALQDVDMCERILRYYADQAAMLAAAGMRDVACDDANMACRVRLRPVGVVAAVTPWNYPLLQSTLKYSAAMAAGCAVLAKPPELAPLTSLRLGALAIEAGAPPGALQVLIGDRDVGAELVARREIDYVSFTGSERAGVAIMQAAARNVRPVSLELGGKGTAAIFADADVATAARWTALGAFLHSGQVCSATSRLLVHRSLYHDVLRRILQGCRSSIAVGRPLKASEWFEMGAMISEQQLERADGFVQRAVAQGARVACGGKRINRAGFWYEPTVLLDVAVGSEMWHEEVFGPVLSIHSFDSDDEAIHLANDSEYGLAAAVFTDDDAIVRRFEEEVRVGMLWVNCSQPIDVQVPWGGVKRSGFGREMGPEGMHEFLCTHSSMRCSRDYFPA